MRSLIFVILAGLLTLAVLATAQEEAATEAAAEQAESRAFVPSEEVAADTAVAFPTDI
ncbi:MAG: hypothetical protein KJO35_04155 [Gammaproteobacteria bacterium]|nr:hypothetical protein [Gammaproteobacteria bacterium]NNF67732.1 hypothetical protein [Gammaproteobacteria bacterium]